TSPASGLQSQTAQRPPRHSPAPGAPHYSADAAVCPGLHPRGPPGASHTHGDTVRPVVATGLAQRGWECGAFQTLSGESLPHTAGSGASVLGAGSVQPT